MMSARSRSSSTSIAKSADRFDIVHAGDTAGKSKREAADIVAPFIEAGATWWNEAPLPWKTTLEEVRARIEAGPPKI